MLRTIARPGRAYSWCRGGAVAPWHAGQRAKRLAQNFQAVAHDISTKSTILGGSMSTNCCDGPEREKAVGTSPTIRRALGDIVETLLSGGMIERQEGAKIAWMR